MPTLKQLRYLVALAQALHFRRAAEQCHVTQPTLSNQIQELENDLGVQLVERSRRHQIVLTPIRRGIPVYANDPALEHLGSKSGSRRVFAEASVPMPAGAEDLRDVQDIIDLGRHGQRWFDGTIKLGALPTLGPYLLPHVLPALHRDFPGLKLYVREGMPAALLRSLASAELDLLLFPLPITGGDFSSVRLFREQLWVVVPSDHPLAAHETIDRSDLAGETVLALEPGHRLYEQVEEICSDIGANLTHDFEGTSLDTLRLMVGMGLGISFMPTVYVLSETPKDTLTMSRKGGSGRSTPAARK